MSFVRTSGLRRSRFVDSESHDGLKRPLSLTEFTKVSHRRLLSKHDLENEHQDDTAIIAAAETKNIHSAENQNDDNISIHQCIISLNPHLTVFRDACDTAAKLCIKSKDKNNEITPDDEDEVPGSLLRLVRFFAWKWPPIKKALLRPPPTYHENSSEHHQEVELGLTYRLRLAKACWKKGLLASAEYESLCASFDRMHANKCHDGSDEHKRSQRDDVMERVRFALMRLPTEIVTDEKAMLAWRHVNEMLLEVFKARDGSNDCHGEKIDQVADWALTSWTAFLVSQGMDASPTTPLNHNTSKSTMSAIESQFANILSNSDATSGNIVLAQAVATRIDELMTPDILKSLNSVHIFSLGRLLARFHSSEISEIHIAKSIDQCVSLGGMTCVEELSRLIAIYVCSICALNESAAEVIAGLKKRLLIKMDTSTDLKRPVNDEVSKFKSEDAYQKADQLQRQSFLDLLLNAATHLIRTSKSQKQHTGKP